MNVLRSSLNLTYQVAILADDMGKKVRT